MIGESVHVLTCLILHFSTSLGVVSSVQFYVIMDLVDLSDVSFLPNSSIGELCVDLNTIVGEGTWYNTFQVQNIKVGMVGE